MQFKHSLLFTGLDRYIFFPPQRNLGCYHKDYFYWLIALLSTLIFSSLHSSTSTLPTSLVRHLIPGIFVTLPTAFHFSWCQLMSVFNKSVWQEPKSVTAIMWVGLTLFIILRSQRRSRCFRIQMHLFLSLIGFIQINTTRVYIAKARKIYFKSRKLKTTKSNATERFELTPCQAHCQILLLAVHCLTKSQAPTNVLPSHVEGVLLVLVPHHSLYMRYKLSTVTISSVTVAVPGTSFTAGDE